MNKYLNGLLMDGRIFSGTQSLAATIGDYSHLQVFMPSTGTSGKAILVIGFIPAASAAGMIRAGFFSTETVNSAPRNNMLYGASFSPDHHLNEYNASTLEINTSGERIPVLANTPGPFVPVGKIITPGDGYTIVFDVVNEKNLSTIYYAELGLRQ